MEPLAPSSVVRVCAVRFDSPLSPWPLVARLAALYQTAWLAVPALEARLLRAPPRSAGPPCLALLLLCYTACVLLPLRRHPSTWERLLCLIGPESRSGSYLSSVCDIASS